MKEIIKPENKNSKELSGIKHWIQNYKKMNPVKKDKIKTYTITSVIVAILGVYVATQFFTSGKKDNPAPEQTQNSESTDNFYTPKPTPEQNINTTADSNQSPLNRTDEQIQPTEPDDNYTIPDTGYTILRTFEGQNACYVYIPIGYEMCESGTAINLKPVNYSVYVDGDNPLNVTWDNISYFDELKANSFFDVLEHTSSNHLETYTYTVLDSYDYIAHEQASATVYIIEIKEIVKPSNTVNTDASDIEDRTSVYYRIMVDLKSKNGSYPSITILEEDLRMLNDRYPDVTSLARAIFIPVDVNEHQEYNTTETTTKSEEEPVTENK